MYPIWQPVSKAIEAVCILSLAPDIMFIWQTWKQLLPTSREQPTQTTNRWTEVKKTRWGQQSPSLEPYLASLTLWYVQLIRLEISISLCSFEFLHCISKCASLNKTKKLPNSTSEKPQMIHIIKANGTKRIHVSNKKNPKCNQNVAGNFPIYHH
jgi:hypothetical protein